MHFSFKKTLKINPKMISFWEARGGPTNQLFAHWTLLGDTLPPKGTPQCPRGGPGRPNGGQGAPKWSQNGAKIEPKGSQMERKWSSRRGSKIFENVIFLGVVVGVVFGMFFFHGFYVIFKQFFN